MIVKVQPGYQCYREGYLRTEDDGVFRLYDPPPSDPDKPHYADHAKRKKEGRPNPTRIEKWLGPGIVEATQFEKDQFENNEELNLDFSQTAAAHDPEAVMGRGAAIMRAINLLDHGDVTHWLRDGRPDPTAVSLVGNLVNVTTAEVEAVMPGIVRDPKLVPQVPRQIVDNP